jgi:hypothetical protein
VGKVLLGFGIERAPSREGVSALDHQATPASWWHSMRNVLLYSGRIAKSLKKKVFVYGLLIFWCKTKFYDYIHNLLIFWLSRLLGNISDVPVIASKWIRTLYFSATSPLMACWFSSDLIFSRPP